MLHLVFLLGYPFHGPLHFYSLKILGNTSCLLFIYWLFYSNLYHGAYNFILLDVLLVVLLVVLNFWDCRINYLFVYSKGMVSCIPLLYILCLISKHRSLIMSMTVWRDFSFYILFLIFYSQNIYALYIDY
jgi:hypothetical protein